MEVLEKCLWENGDTIKLIHLLRKKTQPFLEEEKREEKLVKEEEKRELKKRHEEKDANQEKEKPREDANKIELN